MPPKPKKSRKPRAKAPKRSAEERAIPRRVKYNRLIFNETEIDPDAEGDDRVNWVVNKELLGYFGWKNRGNSDMVHVPDAAGNFHSLHTRNPQSILAWESTRSRTAGGWATIAFRMRGVKFDRRNLGLQLIERNVWTQLLGALFSDKACTTNSPTIMGTTMLTLGKQLTADDRKDNRLSMSYMFEDAIDCGVEEMAPNRKRRFVFKQIKYEIIRPDKNEYHANIVLMDVKMRQFRIFEPHGEDSEMWRLSNQAIIDALRDLQETNDGQKAWKYAPNPSLCPISGPQTNTGGSCAAWSAFFMLLMIRSPGQDARKMINRSMEAVRQRIGRLLNKEAIASGDAVVFPQKPGSNALNIHKSHNTRLHNIFITGFAACLYMMIPRLMTIDGSAARNARGTKPKQVDRAKVDLVTNSIRVFAEYIRRIHADDAVWQWRHRPRVYVDNPQVLINREKRAAGKARAAAFRAAKATRKARAAARKARAAANKANKESAKTLKTARVALAKSKQRLKKLKKRYKDVLGKIPDDMPLDKRTGAFKRRKRANKKKKAAKKAAKNAKKAADAADADAKKKQTAMDKAQAALNAHIGSPAEQKAKRAEQKATRLAKAQAALTAAEAKKAADIAKARQIADIKKRASLTMSARRKLAARRMATGRR